MTDVLTYGAIFIVFVIVVYYVNKMNVAKINEQVAKSEANNQLPELAKILGLNYQSLSDQGKNKKTIINMGDLITGVYNGIEIEILFKMNASHSNELITSPHAHSYTYSTQRTIILKVNNSGKRTFQLSPKNEYTVSDPTGDSSFDEKFSFSGNFRLEKEFRKYCVDLGWMNLKLTEDSLIFLDDYSESIASEFSSRNIKNAVRSRDALMNAVHPIWKTSMQNQKMDLDSSKELIDQLITIAKSV